MILQREKMLPSQVQLAKALWVGRWFGSYSGLTSLCCSATVSCIKTVPVPTSPWVSEPAPSFSHSRTTVWHFSLCSPATFLIIHNLGTLLEAMASLRSLPHCGRGSIPILSSFIIYFPLVLERQRRSWYFTHTSSGSTRVYLKPRIKNGLFLFELLASRVP